MCGGPYIGDRIMCVHCVLYREGWEFCLWGYVVGLVMGGICGMTRGVCLIDGGEVA